MFTTKKLVYTAVFVALNTLANIFSVPLAGSNYISFTYFVCFVAAMYLGILPATIVAMCGDLLGCLIAPKGSLNLLILLASTLLGVIPALVFKIKGLPREVKLVISLLICTVVCTAFLNTMALWLLYAKNTKSFWVYLGGRFPFQVINTFYNGVLIFVVLKTSPLDRLLRQAVCEGEEAVKYSAVKESSTEQLADCATRVDVDEVADQSNNSVDSQH